MEAAARCNKPIVAIDKAFPPAHQEWLEARCARVFILGNSQHDEELRSSADLTASVEALLWYGHGPVNAELLSRFPNVKVVSNFGAGYEHVDCTECTARGIPVGHTPGVLSETVADHAMAILLAAARDVVNGAARAARPDFTAFNPNDLGKQVSGTTIGIVGMGSIGSAVARRAAFGFNQKVLYYSRRQKSEDHESSCGGAAFCSDLNALLSRSDYVVLAMPATPETDNLMGVEQFRAMKNDSILVNIGRGNCVDHNALAEALKRNELGSVALDVTEPEPLPRTHPLVCTSGTALEGRVLITPHQGSATSETRMQMMQMSFDNLIAGLQSGVRLPWLVRESAEASLFAPNCPIGSTKFSGISP